MTSPKRPAVLRLRYMLLTDLVCVLASVTAAFVIRYEALIRIWPYVRHNWPLFLVAPVVRLATYVGFRLYKRLWRYASVEELKAILWAGATGSAIIWLIDLWIMPLVRAGHTSSRSVLLLESVLSIGALGATRLLLRLWQRRMSHDEAVRLRAFVERPERVLIAGAGDAGVMILREMLANPHLGLQAVGFVDDDPEKQGIVVQGVRVMGGREEIPELGKRLAVDQVIIAMPTAPGKAIRAIRAICERAGLRVKIVPGIYELLGGQISVSQVREVRIEDLLRRDTVQTDTAQVRALLHGRRVLVTGAGGSIGSELCRQIARCDPDRLVLLGHGENSIFAVANELRRAFPRVRFDSVIADVRHEQRMADVFAEHRPEIVFHAAAHKHVPLMEANITEAVTNNVEGTLNVVAMAERFGSDQFVLISTDKAVNPTSVMGVTKRVAELIVQDAARRTERRFVAVRFGNVLGSRGSVVPVFQEQIARGGPVTVTHPDMTRFFMTIPEASQLVLQAAAFGRGGEVFILDMGEPVRIIDLARDLIALSGYQEGRDIDIVFTGLRPGEKPYEELFRADEECDRTVHKRIFAARGGPERPSGALGQQVGQLIRSARDGDASGVRRVLRDLVPEYTAGAAHPVGGGGPVCEAAPARGGVAAAQPTRS